MAWILYVILSSPSIESMTISSSQPREAAYRLHLVH
jgi:hypothetical protein